MTQIRTLPGRSVVAVGGPDATTLLQGLVTNGPPEEGAVFSALLTPQGKVLFDFTIVKRSDGYAFDIAADAAEGFIKRLKLYRLRAKVDIGVDDQHIVCIDTAMADGGRDASANVSTDTTKGRIIASVGEFGNIADDAEYDARRIAAGIPEWGADFGSDEVFLMDVNYDLLGGVDYKKGCFVGQEVASRMKRKGDARKRTVIADFDGAPPEKGTPVTAGDSTLGHVMSGVDGAALALVRLDRWESARADGRAVLAGDRELRLRLPDYLQQD